MNAPIQSGRRRRVLVNSLYLVVARNIGMLARLVLVVAAAFYLGPADYGLFQVGYAWYLVLLPLAGGGLQLILGREIGRDAEAGRSIILPSLLIRTGLALTAALLCVLGGMLLEDGDRFRLLIEVFAIALFGRSIASWADAVFTAHHASRYNFRLALVFRMMEAILALTVLIAGQGIIALALVHAICWWLQALAGLGLLFARFRPAQMHWAPERMAGLLWHGLPLALTLLLIAWQIQGPLVLYKPLSVDAESAGELALAFQVFQMSATLAWAVGAAALPALSAADSGEDRHAFISAMVRYGIVGGTALALGAWALGSVLIETLFGPAYAGAGTMLGPALLLFIPTFIGNNIWQAFIAESRIAAALRCALVGAIASTAAVVPLSILFAAPGSIAGTGIGLTIWVICLLVEAHRYGMWRPFDAGLGIALGLLSSSLSLALYLALAPSQALLAFCGAILLLAAAGWKLVANDHERRAIRSLMRMKRCSS